MSEQVWLTLLTGALGLLGVALGLFGRAVWTEIRDHNRRVGELEAFEARFNATEAGWNLWRETFLDETTRRRAEIDKRLDAHAVKIDGHESRVTRIERNGH